MAKSRLLMGSIAASVVLGAIFAGGPYLTLHGLQSAARAGDAQAISKYVDFDRVRTNTKVRLRSSIERSVPSGLSSLGMIGAAVAGTAMDPLVDSVISPQTIASWLKDAPAPAAAGTSSAPSRELETETHFVSLSEFTASVKNGNTAVELVLSREYLRWRVTDVRFDLSLEELLARFNLPALGTQKR